MPLKTAILAPTGEDSPGWYSQHVLRPALEAPERAQRLFHQRVQWTVFAQVPLFAVWLRLFYRRRERFFVPHLVFALHFHTLAFVLLVAGTAGTLILGTQIPSVIAYLAVVAMLFLLTPAGLCRGGAEDPRQANRPGVRARMGDLVRIDGAPDRHRTDGVIGRIRPAASPASW